MMMALIPGPSAVQAAYTAACGTGAGGVTAVLRGAGFGFTGTDFRGAIGDATLRNAAPCSSPTATQFDLAAVLPVNIEGPGAGQIVQLGWGRCAAVVPGHCGNLPLDGNLHFIYICNDSSNGVPCVADSWAGTPVIGHRYRFRIQYGLTAPNRWDHWITDLTTGVTKKGWVTSTWRDGWATWWGAETSDDGSMMGSAHVANNSLLYYWMQYYRTSIGSWTVVTDIDVPPDLAEFGGPPNWYSYGIFSQNYTDDAVNIYTLDR